MVTAGSTLTDRLPWNWTELRNLNNQLVATSVTDFMDGTISAAMNYDEYGLPAASGFVWTGIRPGGIADGDFDNVCSNWTNNFSGRGGWAGDTSAVSGASYIYSGTRPSCDNTNMRLLCMETVGTAGLDGDPDPVNVLPAVAYTSGGVATSNTVTVTDIVGSVMVTITPSGGTANIIKNGVPVGGTTTNVNNNDTIAFSLTTPTTAGQKNTATLTFGPDSYSWWAGYADNANIGMIFVTSNAYLGGLGGLAGADTKCQTAATSAGLNGTWTAILSSSTTDAIDRIPFNFGHIYKVNKSSIANNWAQLWSASLNSPVDVNENNVPVFTEIMSSTQSNGRKKTTFCNNWTTSGYEFQYIGNTTVSDGRWIDVDPNNGRYCNEYRRLYCIASLTPAQNNIPVAIDIKPKVVYVSGARTGSSSFVISGIGSPINVSISGSGGDPKFSINGGAEIASSTISNGQSVEFFMDAPATGGNTYTATIILGSTTYYWNVSYANPANTGKIFVTSIPYLGSLGGLVGADAKCNELADIAGLGGTWTALLSTNTVDAVDRVPFNWGKLRRIDNVIVANNWDEFISGNLAVAPNISETGAQRDAEVMVSSFPNLKKKLPSNCNNWTAAGYEMSGAGYSGVPDTRWLENGSNNGRYCNEYRSIYCMSTGP